MKTSANRISVTEEPGHGTFYQSNPGRHRHRCDLCLHGARRCHDLPGDRSSELRPGRNGDVLDLHLLAVDAVGYSLLVGVPAHAHALVRWRHRDRATAVQAAREGADPDQRRRLHRTVFDHQQRRRPDLGLYHQTIPDAVRILPLPRQPTHLHPPGRHDRRDGAAADPALLLLPVHADRPGNARSRLGAGIGAAGRHQHLAG